MRELIKIEYRDDNALVSARELHEFLEVGRDFSTWVKGRIDKYGFEEGIDFTILNLAPQNGGTSWGGSNKKDYAINIDMAKELCMVENNDKGRKARKYFIECEKKLKEVIHKPQLPSDYLSALKALVASEEEKSLMKPKVEYYENVLQPNTYIKLLTMSEIAKDLSISAQKLNKELNEKGIIYKQNRTWMLYAKYQDMIPEYFDYTINEHGQTLKATEKGREFIINLLQK